MPSDRAKKSLLGVIALALLACLLYLLVEFQQGLHDVPG
jgi:hypothetical protein